MFNAPILQDEQKTREGPQNSTNAIVEDVYKMRPWLWHVVTQPTRRPPHTESCSYTCCLLWQRCYTDQWEGVLIKHLSLAITEHNRTREAEAQWSTYPWEWLSMASGQSVTTRTWGWSLLHYCYASLRRAGWWRPSPRSNRSSEVKQ